MRNKLLALLFTTCISLDALAADLAPREALAAFSPTALQVLEAMETERGLAFTDDEIRSVARSTEFQSRLTDAFFQRHLLDGQPSGTTGGDEL